VTIEEAAALLGISESSVRRSIAAGELHSIKLGRRRLVPVAAIEDLLRGGS
jgi:excisionase family DNA binding protein